MCEQRQRQQKRKASMVSHEAFHAAHARRRRSWFSSQSLTCGTDSERAFARMKVAFPFGFIHHGATPSVYKPRSAVMAMPSALGIGTASRDY